MTDSAPDLPPPARPAKGFGALGPDCPWLARGLANIRVGLVLAAVLAVTAVGLPIQWAALRLRLPPRRRIPALYHRILLRLIGVRVHLNGAPAPARPLLLLSNHASWLDIPVIGSVTPLFFVAKSEVAGWPLVGLLAKFQRTVFVDRQRRHATGSVNREIAERLHEGDPVVLFAEGTSSDGNRVLPFRSALVGAVREAVAAAEAVTVQPMAVAYVRLQGLPMGRLHRPAAAWFGDIELAPHLLDVLRHGAIDVEVSFGTPLVLDGAHDRKEVTRDAEQAVRALCAASLLGRGARPAPAAPSAALPPAPPSGKTGA
ncbi:1-acyl-sn-glycerol-3-phosphate acyltransferase [Xanthobacter sp. KR7-225]|uniref:lysophospholipid acyltransferase family protein n=1 Tax=Xanthobacter sp. KR7-225 TaxID=3156613 RepID=UPI0032B547B2